MSCFIKKILLAVAFIGLMASPSPIAAKNTIFHQFVPMMQSPGGEEEQVSTHREHVGRPDEFEESRGMHWVLILLIVLVGIVVVLIFAGLLKHGFDEEAFEFLGLVTNAVFIEFIGGIFKGIFNIIVALAGVSSDD